MSSKAPTLDYLTAAPQQGGLSPWRGLLRYVLLGPFTGASVGATKTVVALSYWLAAGRPDFYFRGGWNGVESHLIIMCVGGFVTGLGFGFAVLCFEYLFGRRCRVGWQVSVAIGLAIAVYSLDVGREFRAMQPAGFKDVLLSEGRIIALAGLSAILLSRAQSAATTNPGS